MHDYRDGAAIRGWHAHVYFDAATLEQARALCSAAAERFAVTMGRLHQRPVGPHPQWSCQLAFRAEALAAVLPWLLLNRDGLTVLLHPLSGEPLADHRDRALWLGAAQPLDLSMLPERAAGEEI